MGRPWIARGEDCLYCWRPVPEDSIYADYCSSRHYWRHRREWGDCPPDHGRCAMCNAVSHLEELTILEGTMGGKAYSHLVHLDCVFVQPDQTIRPAL
jgi:hypothetical protein